jgi:hypothetical protein
MQKVDGVGPVFKAFAIILAVILLLYSVRVFAIKYELQGNLIEQLYASK